MTAPATETAESARLWAIRVHGGAFDDWEGLTEWLEGDPARLAAYEAALEADAWAAELLAQASPPVVAIANPPHRRWRYAGGAVAALVAGVLGWTALDSDSPTQEIATAPGERRTVELADGSRIILNGGTRVTFDPDTPRHVELVQGEALFEVRHDASDAFVVVAGKTRLLDVGTMFNVVREGGALEVAVAEGAVVYEPGPRQIRLNPGDSLSRPKADAEPMVRKADRASVGSWQTGQLQYSRTPLDRIARDLGRNIGREVRAAAGSERRCFSGTLATQGSPGKVLARAGPLLGVRFEPQGDAWTMTLVDGERC